MRQLLLRYGPVLAASTVIFLCLAHWGQLVSPYIEHDDWDFLLPPGWGHGYASPWQKTLSEGRWLNYFWYLGIGAHWSPGWAARVFLGLTVVFACLLGFVKDRPWISGLAILVAFFSPAFAALSAWPSVLSASALVLALAVLCQRTASAGWRLVGLGVGVFLSVMSYAGAAPVILLAHVYLGRTAKARPLLAALAVYLAAYGLAVLAIATLNYFFHDHFGLRIEVWRQAHPPHGMYELWRAAGHQLVRFATSISSWWGPCLVWAAAVVVLLRDARQRGRVLALLAASALALSCDVGLASLNGMLIPVRAMGWVWIALMLPMVLLGTDRAKASLALGGAGLLWMLVLGVIAWSDFYRVRAPAGNYVYALAATLSEIPGDRQVVLVDDVTRIRSMRVMNNKPGLQMRMALLKIRGIHARACEPAFCDAVKAYVRRQRIGALAFQYQGRQVVYFRPGASLAVANGTTRLLPRKTVDGPTSP